MSTDYWDTSAYSDVAGWDYYSWQDISPDDYYYSPQIQTDNSGWLDGFGKIGDALGGLINKTGGYFDQWVDYKMQDSIFGENWRPSWAAPEPEDNNPVIINSGIDKQTLMLAGGVALALVLIVALKK